MSVSSTQQRSFVVAARRGEVEDRARAIGNETGYRVLFARSPDELLALGLEELEPRYIFFTHWSWIIPADIYERHECVIFHMTDVPYGRGGSPLQNLVVRGHTETVVSALRCTDVVDGGPVYLKRPLSLEGAAHEIYERADNVVLEMLRELLIREPEPVEQRGEVVTFDRRTPRQSDLSAATTPEEAHDLIRMLDAPGYPHAFVETEHLRLELVDSTLQDGEVTARVRIRRR
jgi:methionyl-tRNA formyltransferase